MSSAEENAKNSIKLFRTTNHDCSYLADRLSRTLFVDPELKLELPLYEELTQAGFRRSGKHLYRPDCQQCHSCIPARIPISAFNMKRRFRRVNNLNADLRLDIQPSSFREDDYQLFERYIALRHSDGDMYPASQNGYEDFLAINREFSFHIRFFLGEKLVALAVTDRLYSGLSAIYTFFDPDLSPRSLGVFSILSQIELCKRWEMPYLYLGYWVPGCQKMNYKTQYQPTQLLIDGQWREVRQEAQSSDHLIGILK